MFLGWRRWRALPRRSASVAIGKINFARAGKLPSAPDRVIAGASRGEIAMPPGRPPTPTYLNLLRGNPSHRPLRAEPEPTIAPECPEPPAFIVGHAADEWWRVAPELHRVRLLSVLDVPALAAYCYAYAQWRTAVEALARMAANDPVMSGLLVRTTVGDARRNPLVKVAADAATDMLGFAAEFGLTPIARARLAAAGYEPPQGGGKFDGLLA
jgi:P27 family predicted phage terminase small subunit